MQKLNFRKKKKKNMKQRTLPKTLKLNSKYYF